ncbi:MAG: hypothetical protein M0Q02_04935 [Candidatus Muirbacterium halophilum]|nr:hypothetical protein [Candidatus Muirbacterium halophilum]
MKSKDIAELFGISENSVSSIVKRMEEEKNKDLSLRDILKRLMRYAQVSDLYSSSESQLFYTPELKPRNYTIFKFWVDEMKK